MDTETFQNIIELYKEYEKLSSLKHTMDNEDSHWWNLLTPDTKNDEGICLPKCIRKKLYEDVCNQMKLITDC
jgi:hypothetical protein